MNLAARLQSAAQPGSVLISSSTARAVKHLFELDDLGEITVKGKAEPVQVYAVQEQKSVPARGRGVEGLASPLVGREREIHGRYPLLTRSARISLGNPSTRSPITFFWISDEPE